MPRSELPTIPPAEPEPTLLRGMSLESLLKLCRKHGVSRMRVGSVEFELAPIDSLSGRVDPEAPPEEQMRQLNKLVDDERERIEKVALVDDFGAA